MERRDLAAGSERVGPDAVEERRWGGDIQKMFNYAGVSAAFKWAPQFVRVIGNHIVVFCETGDVVALDGGSLSPEADYKLEGCPHMVVEWRDCIAVGLEEQMALVSVVGCGILSRPIQLAGALVAVVVGERLLVLTEVAVYLVEGERFCKRCDVADGLAPFGLCVFRGHFVVLGRLGTLVGDVNSGRTARVTQAFDDVHADRVGFVGLERDMVRRFSVDISLRIVPGAVIQADFLGRHPTRFVPVNDALFCCIAGHEMIGVRRDGVVGGAIGVREEWGRVLVINEHVWVAVAGAEGLYVVRDGTDMHALPVVVKGRITDLCRYGGCRFVSSVSLGEEGGVVVKWLNLGPWQDMPWNLRGGGI